MLGCWATSEGLPRSGNEIGSPGFVPPVSYSTRCKWVAPRDGVLSAARLLAVSGSKWLFPYWVETLGFFVPQLPLAFVSPPLAVYYSCSREFGTLLQSRGCSTKALWSHFPLPGAWHRGSDFGTRIGSSIEKSPLVPGVWAAPWCGCWWPPPVSAVPRFVRGVPDTYGFVLQFDGGTFYWIFWALEYSDSKRIWECEPSTGGIDFWLKPLCPSDLFGFPQPPSDSEWGIASISWDFVFALSDVVIGLNCEWISGRAPQSPRFWCLKETWSIGRDSTVDFSPSKGDFLPRKSSWKNCPLEPIRLFGKKRERSFGSSWVLFIGFFNVHCLCFPSNRGRTARLETTWRWWGLSFWRRFVVFYSRQSRGGSSLAATTF